MERQLYKQNMLFLGTHGSTRGRLFTGGETPIYRKYCTSRHISLKVTDNKYLKSLEIQNFNNSNNTGRWSKHIQENDTELFVSFNNIEIISSKPSQTGIIVS